MSDGAKPLLSVRGLNAWYGESQALHGVDLDILPGETVTLLGRNGVGKTTTLRAIMGLLPRRTGTLLFEGRDLLKVPLHRVAKLGVGFVPVRKPGKLPHRTRAVSYALEYGEETLEMHLDALTEGDRVLVIDDVLATGGTAEATVSLVEQGGGTVTGLAVLMELSFLPGRDKVGDLPLTVLHTV